MATLWPPRAEVVAVVEAALEAARTHHLRVRTIRPRHPSCRCHYQRQLPSPTQACTSRRCSHPTARSTTRTINNNSNNSSSNNNNNSSSNNNNSNSSNNNNTSTSTWHPPVRPEVSGWVLGIHETRRPCPILRRSSIPLCWRRRNTAAPRTTATCAPVLAWAAVLTASTGIPTATLGTDPTMAFNQQYPLAILRRNR